MIKETSRRAYYEQVISGAATTQRERILKTLALSSEPLSRRQLVQLTRIPINAVCGRVKALLQSDLIEVRRIDTDPQTGQRVEYLGLIRDQKELL